MEVDDSLLRVILQDLMGEEFTFEKASLGFGICRNRRRGCAAENPAQAL
jgi:hypothetical protein